MNEKIVKTIRSRSFVVIALLNRGVADSEPLRVRRRAYLDGSIRRDAVFEPKSSQSIEVFILSCRRVVRRFADWTISSRSGAILNLGSVIRY